MKKETYQEKVTAEFAPYAAVEQHPEIERLLWEHSNQTHRRSVCTKLRHRFSLLMLTSCVLRCESLHHAELSTQACGNVGIAHPLGPQIVCQALGNKGDICSVSNPCQKTRSVSK